MRRSFLLLGVLLLVSGGCGPKLIHTSVAGTVTWKGKALQSGTIFFMPLGLTRAPTAVGEIVDGKYQISQEAGPIVGQHRVEIRAFREKLKKDPRLEEYDKMFGTRARQVLPIQYNDQSTLTFEVKPGANEANFEL